MQANHSSSVSPARSAPLSRRVTFLQARLASALAIAPLGVWTCVHLWHNLAAFDGADAWQSAVTGYPHPLAQALTAIVVLGPLLIHTVWGVGRLVTSRFNARQYHFYPNFKYVLHRLAAIGVLMFLGAHLWLAMIRPRVFERQAEPFAEIAQQMHFHTPTLVVYLLGTLGVSYHLANGAQTFCMGWGVIASQRALRRLEVLTVVLFFGLLGMSWSAIYALWAAGSPGSLVSFAR
jgi:succinate dehydrogenase / fumarate reductase, cytochrome b subunit